MPQPADEGREEQTIINAASYHAARQASHRNSRGHPFSLAVDGRRPARFLQNDQVPGAGSTWFMHGAVVALINEFAFVSMSSGEVDTYVSNLLAPGASGAINTATAWKPTTVSGQVGRARTEPTA